MPDREPSAIGEGARRRIALFLPLRRGVRRSATWVQPRVSYCAEQRTKNTLVSYAVSPDPRDHEVVAALQVYRPRDCDVFIGVGGRGAMDTAKAAVLSSNGGSVADYDGFDRVTQPTPPTVMIPTTIGSGAEILQSCAIDDTSRRRTVTMLGCALVADACLVDPRLLGTLSAELVAAGRVRGDRHGDRGLPVPDGDRDERAARAHRTAVDQQ